MRCASCPIGTASKRRQAKGIRPPEWGKRKADRQTEYGITDKFTVEVKQMLHRIASFGRFYVQNLSRKAKEEGTASAAKNGKHLRFM